jgi:putative flippase GtrA
MVGTAVGLVIKYILDKKYIFQFRAKNISHDSFTFFLYTVMGIFTTIIFWGFEYAFDYIYDTKEMRYLGGIIGLAIGYYVKYKLDKRFVFLERHT